MNIQGPSLTVSACQRNTGFILCSKSFRISCMSSCAPSRHAPLTQVCQHCYNSSSPLHIQCTSNMYTSTLPPPVSAWRLPAYPHAPPTHHHTTTGCQQPTLKSTRMTFQSPDRVMVLSLSNPPHHYRLHFDCESATACAVFLNSLLEIQPDGQP